MDETLSGLGAARCALIRDAIARPPERWLMVDGRSAGRNAAVVFCTVARARSSQRYTASTPDFGLSQRSNPMSNAPTPQSVTLHQGSRVLEVGYSDGQTFRLPFELLRVYSPSAEVQGHGPGQEVLQTGKRDVEIVDLTPVGHYALQPKFSDGHDTGIFSWAYLYDLGSQQQVHWDRYLRRLAEAGVDRDAPMVSGAASACGHVH
jgi:DUF971 family protein